ncbi:MAG: hypothetical protein EOM66_11555 [Clostridia bacterium]|nr:hypothetical protein [Clostridia bacterium]
MRMLPATANAMMRMLISQTVVQSSSSSWAGHSFALLLYTGRLIYPEEFERGDRVVMVDEQLAVKLFQYAEPVDREVVLGGKSYTIVGIVRDQKRVGDYQDYSFYVPYRAIEKAGEPVDALCLEATPVPGAGGWAAFQTGVATLAGGGNTISLTKEKMNATLPLRVLLCCIGFAISFCGISALNRRAKGVYLRYRERLVVTYAIRLTPWVIGQALLLAVGYALALLLLAQVFVQLIAPVYTFPEWVPAILVEPKDIAAAFWNCWQPVATLRELRSPEALRIRFFGMLMGWCCAALAAILMLGWKRAVTPPEKLPKE